MEAQEILRVSKEKMKKSIESFEHHLTTLRTGQASSQQFEAIPVECYGSTQALGQISNISVPESRQILIKPWDASLLSAIEKAVMQSNMSVNPQNDGKVLRITIPPLTDQSREESIKHAREFAEEAKVSVRNVRRDANEKLKKLKTASEISEDDLKHYEKETQNSTDSTIQIIQNALEEKERIIRGV